MRQAAVVTMWLVGVAVVGWMVFSPEHGLLYGGPMATSGLGLLGGAICVAARDAEKART
jgi:hypothetical protein